VCYCPHLIWAKERGQRDSRAPCRNKTLNGGRAERNEYILLHEFHRLKYICPDKTFGKKVPKSETAADDADGEGGGTKAGKS
jgi:DNA polymerase alpha subunit A